MFHRSSVVVALSFLLGGGCLALSPDEMRALERIERAGYSLDHPPAEFVPAASDRKAALPGIGNFYLAANGGGGLQWLLGTGNLLLWPISPAWSICEGYVDANTMNKRALAAYCDEHPDLFKEPPDIPDNQRPNNPQQSTPPPSPSPQPPPPPPAKPLYFIVGIEPLNDGQYVVKAEVEDRSQTFKIINEIKRDVQNLVREDFASQHTADEPKDIRESLKYNTEEDGRILVFTAWAFSVRPVEDGWKYDPGTRKGQVRLRVKGGMPASEAKQWARDNISAIVSEKNIVIEAGSAPPVGAKFRSLGENFTNGVLTVEFEVVE